VNEDTIRRESEKSNVEDYYLSDLVTSLMICQVKLVTM
jgi:hypothetical protein